MLKTLIPKFHFIYNNRLYSPFFNSQVNYGVDQKLFSLETEEVVYTDFVTIYRKAVSCV